MYNNKNNLLRKDEHSMSIMYLAKINLNSRIFDVYRDELKISDVTDRVYKKFNMEEVFSNTSNEKYTDSMGNTKRYVRKSEYRIVELDKKENMVITGKIVRAFNKLTEKFNKVSNKMEHITVEESASIYFYFDTKREMITFCERQSFGYNQFMKAFNAILNKCVPEYEFEVFLEKDPNLLEAKIKSLKVVNKIKATLIPPNSNEEDLQDLRRGLEYIGQCQDMNASKMNVEMSTTDKESSLKMESKYMKDIFKAVSRGYGDVTAIGKNHNGREQVVNSNQDAAYTSIINDTLDKKDYNQEAKQFIDIYIATIINIGY